MQKRTKSNTTNIRANIARETNNYLSLQTLLSKTLTRINEVESQETSKRDLVIRKNTINAEIELGMPHSSKELQGIDTELVKVEGQISLLKNLKMSQEGLTTRLKFSGQRLAHLKRQAASLP